MQARDALPRSTGVPPVILGNTGVPAVHWRRSRAGRPCHWGEALPDAHQSGTGR